VINLEIMVKLVDKPRDEADIVDSLAFGSPGSMSSVPTPTHTIRVYDDESVHVSHIIHAR
jgi:hypothetical protein